MKTISGQLVVAAAATVLSPLPAAHADPVPPCSSGQVSVSSGGSRAAMGHREVILIFSLAPDAESCTLTGYPGVDSGAGGPLLHAERTPSGFMGGLPASEIIPPTITLSSSEPAIAVVEGVTADSHDVERKCPTYTGLRVTPPDTEDTVTVPVSIDTCELQVHPMGSEG
jgi:Protein of unknown function (DUF4232)